MKEDKTGYMVIKRDGEYCTLGEVARYIEYFTNSKNATAICIELGAAILTEYNTPIVTPEMVEFFLAENNANPPNQVLEDMKHIFTVYSFEAQDQPPKEVTHV